MSPPTIRINTFVKQNDKPHVDYMSQIFIILQVIFGFDRLPLLGKTKFIYKLLTFTLFVACNSTIIFFTINAKGLVNFIPATIMIRNITATILSYIRCKYMEKYYGELNKFDSEAACRPKVSISCIWNAVQGGLMCIYVVLLFEIPVEIGALTYSPRQMIPLHIINIIEVTYFGHLLNLLSPRLKLINYYIESSLSNQLSESSSLEKEFVYMKTYQENMSQCQMRKIMDLYQVLVDAYDFLIESIKWQLLVFFIAAFVTVLGFLYVYTLNAIRTGEILTDNSILMLGVCVAILVPLFVPCTFSDRLHSEVRVLRELLASRLYENKLDKSGRSIARALLAFTETRDLSFRLLRMLNIDISLPFKFIGLLVTYLIILLQFEKVINP